MRAFEIADKMLGKQHASEGRSAASTAEAFATRADRLEASAAAAELAEVALSEAAANLVLERVELMFTVVGLALPVDVAQLVLCGQDVGEDVAAAAREELLRPLRQQLRGEVEAELQASRFVTSEPVEPEPEVAEEVVVVPPGPAEPTPDSPYGAYPDERPGGLPGSRRSRHTIERFGGLR
jgi:hypothetical protein